MKAACAEQPNFAYFVRRKPQPKGEASRNLNASSEPKELSKQGTLTVPAVSSFRFLVFEL
jgi:hypothetical protein